ncbi:hypothetical protein J437_LFUL016186 [Ladona fulva]|uniref:Nucleoporin p58/p45 n=1 Tax=Ladona fulva TaxID=123851 RepID=A0A8K0KJA1_LADFU|nr:hypothetical protein J437_LFUL016186 [Ladona fulva]
MAGFTFGATATSLAPAATGSSFNFGANKPATTSTGFSFGSNVQSSPFGTPSMAFNTPTSSSAANTFGAISFGTSTSGTPGFGLPAMTPSSTPSFGLTTPGTAVSTQPASTFGIGTFAPTATTTQSALSSGLGTFSSFPQPGLGTATSAPGFLGLQTSTTTAKPLLGSAPLALPTATTTAPTSTFQGLGGIDVSQNKTGPTGSTTTQMDNKAAKETPLPNEILQTVHNFESFMKQQKQMSSEIGRGSVKPLHRVQEETEALKQALASIDNALNRNAALVEKLKTEGAKELQNAEMAQRTHETPAGLQLENSTPIEYFTGLVSGFERDMQTLRQEIENAERHLHNQMQPIALTPQELTTSLRRLHESFVGLAGHLQDVHKTVEEHWEQYLALRRRFYRHLPTPSTLSANTATNSGSDMSSLDSITARPGPTPFSRIGASLTTPVSSLSTAPAGRSPFGSFNPLGTTPSSGIQQPLMQPQIPLLPAGSSFGLGVLPSLQGQKPLLSAPPYSSTQTSFFGGSNPTQGSKRGKR